MKKIILLIYFLVFFLAISPRVYAFQNEPTGWGGWGWGTNLSEVIHQLSFPALEKETILRYDMVQSYWRGSEKSFYGIKEPSLRYWFSHDQLIAVKVADGWATAQKWETVKNEMLENFGPPTRIEYAQERRFGYPGIQGENPQNIPDDFYTWNGEKTSIRATYYPTANRIVILMLSTEHFMELNKARQEASDFKQSYTNEPDGFRGIAWGTKTNTLGAKLQFKRFFSGINGSSGVSIYENPKDELSFGAGHATKITYDFWQDRFMSATIDVKGEADWIYVLRAARAKFGYGLGNDLHPRWDGPKTKIYGSFNKEDNTGYFWFTSTQLEQEKKLFGENRVKTGSGDF